MKYMKHLAIATTFAMLSPLSMLARDKNAHSFTLDDSVTVGSSRLKPGDYKVEWQVAGPAVQVDFLRNGKTVATVPATLQTNDKQVTQDDVVVDRTKPNHETLTEIDFAHQKEALIFTQNGM